eukprot:TRINITY_DN8257_c0_g1_i1.p1 TRINITY_DN8257_c0_g1~~TRINITY_DN8257_c0_g1_i1.p1  ORF type:complete len:504 (+),score=127.97 TRINITY_DN8257_c0_g1_i1:93-1514(+)
MSQPLDKLRVSMIRAAGHNRHGGCCIGSAVPIVTDPEPVIGFGGAARVACGTSFTAVLSTQGEVFTAGCNSRGQLGYGSADTSQHTELRAVPLPSRAVDIACGSSHLLICLEDGRVLTSGNNEVLACGRPPKCARFELAPADGVAGAVRVFAGTESSFVLCGGGEVISFGQNHAGQLCQGTAGHPGPPQRAEGLCGVGVRDIAAGWAHGLALLEDGGVLSWGELCLGSGAGPIGGATRVSFGDGMLKAVSVATGSRHCAVVTEDGSLQLWGSGDGGHLGLGHERDLWPPEPLGLPGGQRAVAVQCNQFCTFATTAHGQVYACGHGACGLPFRSEEKVTEFRLVPFLCYADPFGRHDERAFRCVVATNSAAMCAFYLCVPRAVLRIGDAELTMDQADRPLSEAGVSAESTVHLLCLSDSAAPAAEGGAAGGGGLQVYVNTAAVGAEGTLCVDLHPGATVGDLVAAATRQLQRTG